MLIPLAFLLGQQSLLAVPAQYAVLFFELSFPLERIRRLQIAPGYVIGGALLVALAWNTVFVPRFVFGVGGLFDDNRTLWGVIALLSLAWYALEFKRYWQRRRSIST